MSGIVVIRPGELKSEIRNMLVDMLLFPRLRFLVVTCVWLVVDPRIPDFDLTDEERLIHGLVFGIRRTLAVVVDCGEN